MHILVVDDERIIRVTTADDLRDAGHQVQEFSSAGAALQYMNDHKGEVDIVLTDLKMPEMDGLTLTRNIMKTAPGVYVLLMTAYATIDTAVEAMKLGAYDYISKPFNSEELLLTIRRIGAFKKVREENRELRKHIERRYGMASFVGTSEETSEIFELVKLVAEKSTTVLIFGETGTGKELLTNIIHHNSKRSKEALVRVSCAILSREILESELFGHVKGAFTGAESAKSGRFERAHQGTLYLDDIDDIPYDLQVKLLRVLEEGEIERVGGTETIKVDVRVIASTKKDLRKMVEEGKFREDLFYRLNIFPIRIPPLRERPNDIELLARHFTDEFSDGQAIELTDEVLKILKQYPFPGNVRELKNLMERLVIMSRDGKIMKEMLPMEVRFPDNPHTCYYFGERPLADILREVEENAIREALVRAGGNKAKAAKMLSLPPSTLKTRIEKLQLKI